VERLGPFGGKPRIGHYTHDSTLMCCHHRYAGAFLNVHANENTSFIIISRPPLIKKYRSPIFFSFIFKVSYILQLEQLLLKDLMLRTVMEGVGKERVGGSSMFLTFIEEI